MTNDNHRFDTFALDAFGHRVRVGLTYAETLEFERLDVLEPLDPQGNPLPWEIQSDAERQTEDRWFALYRKHETARLELAAATRLARSRSSSARSQART